MQTLLITGARAPVALHLARLLGQAGYKIVLADSFKHPLGAACRFATYVQIPAPADGLTPYANAINAVINDYDIDLIIPTCEEVFYLAMLVAQDALSAPLDAPSLDHLTTAHNKFAFIEQLSSFGIPVPQTQLLQTTQDVQDLVPNAAEYVFKPVWSRFASRVLIKPTEAELADVRPTHRAAWVAQKHIEGREISVYAYARSGTVIALSAYHSLFRAGLGAGVCFEPVMSDRIQAFVARYVQKTAWTGQISFDLIEAADGTIWPIECNPRATSGLHFFTDSAPFADAVCDGGPFVAPDATGLLGVRLALWVYGLPNAIRHGRLGQFKTALQDTQDILDWPTDPAPKKRQFRALCEIAATALKHRISLQTASTRDIEWDGPDTTAL
ncbi:ATP-grasp domain-containing protein [Nereida sp. MMG025]|uniref:ATP-grasp domain-containing protein n=1 Tax=Nereida sp. MMG025 TaxID=2909981 RepID=UPI001F01C447|nr:ATP-grasp domain-containing protein [Nereida sp. MMG025]MCF6443734.1 ATP-grasp domain-containing protein [Nereida sp. MMG025]